MPIKARFDLAFDGFQLQADLNLPSKGVTTLFGPSGSGKSTLLRCIAGLESSQRGFMQVGETVWQDDNKQLFVPTHQRSLGYVFQEARLFAHLTVEKNLLYGLQRLAETDRQIDWDQVVEMLDISHLLQRKPQKLSGGEQQRISIGRALLSSPKVLLMDEPLAALDHARKQEVLPFIRKLHDELAIPVIYVSHSLQEVVQITDTLVLMSNGKIKATGPITELTSQLNLGHYLGDMSGSVIETTVADHEVEFSLSRLQFSGGDIYVPQQASKVGEKQRVHILSRNVGIALEKPQATTSFLNILEAKVLEVGKPDPENHTVSVKLDVGVPLLACISRKSLHTLRLQEGMVCYALIKAVSLA